LAKIRPVEADLFHAGGRTANGRSSHFYESAQKELLLSTRHKTCLSIA